MKKKLFLLISFILILLVGCKANTFNWDDAISTLQDNGYIIV